MFIFLFIFFMSRTDGELHVSDLFNLNTFYSHSIPFISVQSMWYAWNAVQTLKYLL